MISVKSNDDGRILRCSSTIDLDLDLDLQLISTPILSCSDSPHFSFCLEHDQSDVRRLQTLMLAALGQPRLHLRTQEVAGGQRLAGARREQSKGLRSFSESAVASSLSQTGKKKTWREREESSKHYRNKLRTDGVEVWS